MIDLRPQALGVVLLAGALCGCSAATRSSQEAAVQAPTQRLQTLIALDRRVTEVAFNLALANVELCPSPAPKAGWLLHSASQYSGDLRPEASVCSGSTEPCLASRSWSTDRPPLWPACRSEI